MTDLFLFLFLLLAPPAIGCTIGWIIRWRERRARADCLPSEWGW